MKNQFTPRPLGYPLTISLNHTPAELVPWVTDYARTPRLLLLFQPSSLPPWNSTRGEEKGRHGLLATREGRWRAGLDPGGPGGHVEVWLVDGDGRNRSDHVRRRSGSSAACAPACSWRYCSIQWQRKLHGVLRTLPMQGIDGRLTVELGLRVPAVGWSPATSIRCLRWGRVQSPALGASPRSIEAIPRVERGGEWLVWLVYGGRGSRGRWHLAHEANSGELELRLGQRRAGVYGRGQNGFYKRGRGHGREVGAARGCARGRSTEGVLWRARTRRTRVRLFLPLFKRLQGHKRVNLTKGLVQDLFLAPRAS
jgi:hypothetical protein